MPSSTTTKTKSISKTKAVGLIANNGGKFFTATVTKKNGDPRTMNVRLKSGFKPTPLGYITVWSPLAKSFKTINTQTLKYLSIGGTHYRVR